MMSKLIYSFVMWLFCLVFFNAPFVYAVTVDERTKIVEAIFERNDSMQGYWNRVHGIDIPNLSIDVKTVLLRHLISDELNYSKIMFEIREDEIENIGYFFKNLFTEYLLNRLDWMKKLIVIRAGLNLPYLMLDGMDCLEEVDLSHNQFDRFVCGSSMRHELRILRLSHCKIKVFRGGLDHVAPYTLDAPKLQVLDLSDNNLDHQFQALDGYSVFGDDGSPQDDLRELYLQHNQLCCFPPRLFGMQKITKIDFRGNSVDTIPEYVGLELRKKKFLTECLVDVMHFPESMRDFAETYMKMEPSKVDNCIKTYEMYEQRKEHIKELIKDAPMRHENKVDFGKRLFEGCLIVFCDDGVNCKEWLLTHLDRLLKLSWLKSVRLNNLDLTEVPPEIFNLDQLEYLDMSGNKIKTLPVELKKLTRLKELVFHKNIDFELPLWVREVPYIKINLSWANNLKWLQPELVEWAKTNFPFTSSTIDELVENYRVNHN